MARGRDLAIVATLVACAMVVAVAVALRSVGRDVPRPPPPNTLAAAPPARAWTLHEMRKELLDAEDLDPAERDRRVEAWRTEIRAALPLWTAGSPEDHLALARFSLEVGLETEAIRHLRSVADSNRAVARDAARMELTLRLQGGDVEGARSAFERLRDLLEPEEVAAVQGGVFEEAVRAARARAEGPSPDPEGARSALETARALAAEPEDEEAARLAAAYVALAADPTAWRAALPADAPIPPGPVVVVLSDDFALGEPVLPSVLRRWSKSVPVVLVGRRTGEVREGMRRVRASASQEAERFAERASETGATLATTVEAGGPEERALGVAGPGALVLVVDRAGRLVARISGAVLDPRPLDPVVARLGG